jgi:hypothetical protein
MWPQTGGASHGRIIEIYSDKVIVSSIHKVKKSKFRGPQFEEWYQSGEWKTGAKTYDFRNIESLRFITEQRDRGQDVDPYNIIVMDYGQKHIELNYLEGKGVFGSTVGHSSRSQDQILRLHKLISESMKKRSHESPTTTEDTDLIVNFDGVSEDEARKMRAKAQEMIKDVLDGDEPVKGKKSTPDDPF